VSFDGHNGCKGREEGITGGGEKGPLNEKKSVGVLRELGRNFPEGGGRRRKRVAE